ncbi:hypothetical protein [Vibrio sp. 10N.247.310.34]|uniref:hypothetical protein n=1 Tax=Vibrio sp. 10N.247.310.34 TaxID=3229982 RepID=UPI00354C58F9
MSIDEVIVLLDERIETLHKRMQSDTESRSRLHYIAAINALFEFRQIISPNQ